jgi:hypothetical protein
LGTYSWFISIVAPLPSFHHMQLKQRRWSLWNGKKRPGSITTLTRIFQRHCLYVRTTLITSKEQCMASLA